jgi:hypothetical protein
LDENDRFFGTSCGPYMGHTIRHLYIFHPKEDTKDLKNMSEERIKLDKCFWISYLLKFVLQYIMYLLEKFSYEVCDPFMVTLVGIRAKFSMMSKNEMTTQNAGNIISAALGGGGRRLWDTLPHRAAGNNNTSVIC